MKRIILAVVALAMLTTTVFAYTSDTAESCSIEETLQDTFTTPQVSNFHATEHFIVATITHDDGSRGHIIISQMQQQFRVLAIATNYPCDWQERLIAFWTLTYLNDDVMPTYLANMQEVNS